MNNRFINEERILLCLPLFYFLWIFCLTVVYWCALPPPGPEPSSHRPLRGEINLGKREKQGKEAENWEFEVVAVALEAAGVWWILPRTIRWTLS